MKSDYSSIARGFLGVAIVAGFFGCLWLIMSSATVAPMRDALLVLVGALGAAFASVVQFYFGSSSGSARKTDLLAKENT